MPEKDKSEDVPAPLPVDVISSIPLSVQIAPESLASLGAPPAGTAEPVTAATATPMGGTGTPVNMTVVAPPPPGATVTKAEGLTLSPTTTAAEDKVTEGQRHISRIWEYSQSAIALSITAAIIYCAVSEISSQDLTNSFFLIIGFYFSRLNHQAIGGVGPKPPEQPYTGR